MTMPKGPKGEKRPRDLNQWAKRVADIVSGEVEDREPTLEEQGKDPAAVKRGHLGGLKGGEARAAKMTKPQTRSRSIARSLTRSWASKSITPKS